MINSGCGFNRSMLHLISKHYLRVPHKKADRRWLLDSSAIGPACVKTLNQNYRWRISAISPSRCVRCGVGHLLSARLTKLCVAPSQSTQIYLGFHTASASSRPSVDKESRPSGRLLTCLLFSSLWCLHTPSSS